MPYGRSRSAFSSGYIASTVPRLVYSISMYTEYFLEKESVAVRTSVNVRYGSNRI